jgi:hypothetical protein
MKLEHVIRRSFHPSFKIAIHILTISLLLVLSALAHEFDGGYTSDIHIAEQKHFASLFDAGDTNAPMVAMDWFTDQDAVYFCRVSQEGKVDAARDVGYAIQGGGGIGSRISMDDTNRALLKRAIDALPPSSTKALPKERQILISGIRSNHWFQSSYDRANIPPEVEALYSLTGAYLGWYIPQVNGHLVGRLNSPNYSGTFAAFAPDAGIAVSFGRPVTNSTYYYPFEMKVWDLKQGFREAVPSIKLIPNVPARWESAILSPDGNIVAAAIQEGIYAIDWKAGKMLWQGGSLDQDDYLDTALAVGDGGRTLFTAGARKIGRRDLSTGKNQMDLGSSGKMIVRSLQTSWDGRFLLASYAAPYQGPKSFVLWESGRSEPLKVLVENPSASATLSPDGQKILLSIFGQKNLVILDWKKDSRQVVPLRGPYGTLSAYGLYCSPDGTRLAAHIDNGSIVIYETVTWKPLAQWVCRTAGTHSDFAFDKDGTLFQITDDVINSLLTRSIQSIAD